jgi:hypothetical protein
MKILFIALCFFILACQTKNRNLENAPAISIDALIENYNQPDLKKFPRLSELNLIDSNEIEPQSYDLNLFIDPFHKTFFATVKIQILKKCDLSFITLHAHQGLLIEGVLIDKQ